MTRRPSLHPGVRPVFDRHGVRRFRFRRTRKGDLVIDAYFPGPWGSAEFVVAYEAAIADGDAQSKAPKRPRAPHGTIEHAIESYLASKDYAELKGSTRIGKRHRLDRIRRNLGKRGLTELRPHHIERIMDKLDGPHAANRFKSDLTQIYGYVARLHGYDGPNPAALAKKRKTRRGRHHSWTAEEVARFRAVHPSGSKARLAFELLLNFGAARADAVRLGPRDVTNGALTYRRQKTEGKSEDVIDVTIPVQTAFQREWDTQPTKAFTFLAHGETGKAYTPESFGNVFRDWCVEAGVPGRAHGLRKAGAASLAEAGATEWEIASYLGHSSTKEAATYVAAANRALMAAAGMAKRAKQEQVLSNLAERLNKIDGEDQ